MSELEKCFVNIKHDTPVKIQVHRDDWSSPLRETKAYGPKALDTIRMYASRRATTEVVFRIGDRRELSIAGAARRRHVSDDSFVSDAA